MSREVLVVIGVGGMGAAIARRLGPGREVVLADRDADALSALAQAMREEGFNVEAHVVDVANASSVAGLANAARECGAVAAVAHTAGVSPSSASVSAILHVDLLGTAYILDAFGEVVAGGGAGVVIASMAGTIFAGAVSDDDAKRLAASPSSELLDIPAIKELLVADADSAENRSMAYGIAKRANQLRVQAAATRWGARGARINSVSPGVISTAMGRAELADPSTGEMTSAMVAGSPAGRVGTVVDVAATAEFLLTQGAGFITGTDILVDGGVVASLLIPQLPAPS